MTLSEKDIQARSRSIAIGGWVVMISLYTLVFWLFSETSILSSLRRALINVIPAALLALLILSLLQNFIFGKSATYQSVAHIVFLPLFCMFWLIGIQVGYGLQDGWLQNGVTGRPLRGVALTWQGLQGILLYLVIALFGYAKHFRILLLEADRRFADIQPGTKEAEISPTQIIVKDGSKLVPVPLTDIFLISGAGDYAEVVTKSGTYLSNTRLSQFMETLPNSSFVRVHRSHIVRLDAITSFESAGNGRLSLFLPGSHSVVTSREGARAIKNIAM